MFATTAPLALRQYFLELLHSGTRRNDSRGIRHVTRSQRGAPDERDTGNIPNRSTEALVWRELGGDCLPVNTEPLQHLHRRLGFRLRRELIHDDERPILDLLRQRRPQGAALDFLRDLVGVTPRLWPEHGSAVSPQRRPDVADARTSGPLLTPRLLPAAAHERSSLGRVRPTPFRRV